MKGTERITSRIRKLLALAEGSEGSEAESAARMADKLMREHAVSLHSLREDQILSQDPMEVTAIEVGKSTWSIQLAWALATHCNVSALRAVRRTNRNPWVQGSVDDGKGWKRRTFALAYGHKSDLEVWRYLCSVANREIQRLAKEFRDEYRNDYWETPSRTDVTRFREGAVQGLSTKLREQRYAAKQQDVSSCTAIALQTRKTRADDFMRSKNPRLGSGYSGGVGGSAQGRAAGRSISLNQGLDARRNNKMIRG